MFETKPEVKENQAFKESPKSENKGKCPTCGRDHVNS